MSKLTKRPIRYGRTGHDNRKASLLKILTCAFFFSFIRSCSSLILCSFNPSVMAALRRAILSWFVSFVKTRFKENFAIGLKFYLL